MAVCECPINFIEKKFSLSRPLSHHNNSSRTTITNSSQNNSVFSTTGVSVTSSTASQWQIPPSYNQAMASMNMNLDNSTNISLGNRQAGSNNSVGNSSNRSSVVSHSNNKPGNRYSPISTKNYYDQVADTNASTPNTINNHKNATHSLSNIDTQGESRHNSSGHGKENFTPIRKSTSSASAISRNFESLSLGNGQIHHSSSPNQTPAESRRHSSMYTPKRRDTNETSSNQQPPPYQPSSPSSTSVPTPIDTSFWSVTSLRRQNGGNYNITGYAEGLYYWDARNNNEYSVHINEVFAIVGEIQEDWIPVVPVNDVDNWYRSSQSETKVKRYVPEQYVRILERPFSRR